MKNLVAVGLIVAIACLFLGCLAQEKAEVQKSVKIYGSGASFPAPQIENWIHEFSKANPNIAVEYASKGSGAGINDFKQKLVHFACSDPPVKESEWRELQNIGKPIQFPVVVGAVVVVYSVPIEDLKLDGTTLARIFMGEVEYWDDETIRSLNPGVNLSHEKIWVVHRSDSSGTTEIFTSYLSLVSDEFGKKVGAGKLVDWPVDKLGRGLGGKGNEGVSAILRQTPYSIAYVELAYAIREKLRTARIMNADGYFVKADAETIGSAIAASSSLVPDPREGYREDVKMFLNAKGKDSYPIVAFSHVLLWESYPTKEEAEAIKTFWKWALTEGRKHMVEGYVPIPESVASIALKAIDGIRGG
ncbi:MAG: phosphate ABC transporter substrate-binding protein PstS [Archaeoglobi archaeon]|jgi:phosphate transport system substrate-binding protein|nr:MAG: phosphate ABC transporter substrate-binding protein PstS [Archaeoglobi archaeon]